MNLNFKKEFIKNILFTIVLMVVISLQFYNSNSYYYWFANNLIKTNFKFIYGSNSDLTFDQKSEAKIGRTYFFLNLIKKSTPEDAVILFPESHVFENPRNKVKFNGYMNRKGYVTYFLYPRKVVYENEKGKSEMYDKASHVAIVNNWGYEKLNYVVNNKIPYSVLPINKQN